MPTAPAGPWLEVALAKGLIRPDAIRPASPSALSAATKGVSPLIDPPPANCSEKAFQAKIVKLAEANGWRVYHTHDSRRSAAGWPDLALVRPPVLILAELKTDVGTLSDDQAEWLELLRGVPGIRVRLWRPLLWPAVVAELAAGRD